MPWAPLITAWNGSGNIGTATNNGIFSSTFLPQDNTGTVERTLADAAMVPLPKE
jgi:hypothetical protein